MLAQTFRLFRYPSSKMIGGQATTALAIMWVLVAVVFAFIALRLYTRIKILNQLGSDDHVYTLSGVGISVSFTSAQIQKAQERHHRSTTLTHTSVSKPDHSYHTPIDGHVSHFIICTLL